MVLVCGKLTLNDLRGQLDGIFWRATAHDLAWPFLASNSAAFMCCDLLENEGCQICAWP